MMKTVPKIGWVLIALCLFGGLIVGASATPDEGGPPGLSNGWIVLFVIIAFALGFFAVPMIAGALKREASPELLLLSGLAPLAFLGSAFVSSVLSSSPDWIYLVNAACPLGITLRLASSDDPLESARNIF